MSTLKVENIQHPNAASVALTLDTNGRIGIGTSTPGRTLTIQNSSTIVTAALVSNPANIAYLLFGDTDSDAQGRVQYDNSADALQLYSAGSERLRIDSSGRVGIGTSSVNAGSALHIARNTAGNVCAIRLSGNDGAGDGGAAIAFADNETVKWSIFTRRYSSNNRLYISTAENDTNSSKVTITEGGSVGIGTTSPSTLLHGVGTSAYLILDRTSDHPGIIFRNNGNNSAGISTQLEIIRFETGSGLTERARIDSSGRLLVGTTSSSGVNSNTAPVLAGNFTSFTGTVLASHASPTTLFALENLNATYIVTAMVAGTADATNYYAVSLIGTVVSNSRTIIALKTGGLLSISLSGGNVQGTQNSGVSQYISWSVIRIANL